MKKLISLLLTAILVLSSFGFTLTANAAATTTENGVHVDVLSDRLIVAHNNADHTVELELNGTYQGVYQGRKTEQNKVCLDAESAELFVRLP